VFKWRDSETTVTITFNVAASTKKGDLDIGFNSSAVRVALKGQAPLLEGPVYGALVPAKCKASIKKDVVTVTLHKQTPADWPSLLSPAAVAGTTASAKEPRDSSPPLVTTKPAVASPAAASPAAAAHYGWHTLGIVWHCRSCCGRRIVVVGWRTRVDWLCRRPV
jgi:hypothetical protein